MVERFLAWVRGLPDGRRRELGRAYAERARASGVFVVKPDGSEVPIPPILTPAAIERGRMGEVSRDAGHILAGLERLTERLMTDEAQAPLRARLFGSFSPLEAEGLARTWRAATQLATARVDFLVDVEGRARALEVNSTIPAMQGYSDCIAEAFVRAVAEARGLDERAAEALVAANGRNSDDLLASLTAHHARLGGGRTDGLTIAIVARRGDAQRGELEHYARRWASLGHDAYLAAPDEVTLEEGVARVAGREPDLIYRHIFARRLEPGSAFARVCLEPERHHVLNPIASHLEVKAMLGLLSAAAPAHGEGDGLALSDDERASILRAVPWTRVLDRGPGHAPASGPTGERIDDLAAFTAAHGRDLVLKRSWDYGGKSVFLGADLEEEATQARLRALFGLERAEPVTWPELVELALADREAWVVQELVHARRVPQLTVGEGGALREAELYLDLSAYTNSGAAPRPSGGAVRASQSRIVNILGGGGLAPLVFTDVLARLL